MQLNLVAKGKNGAIAVLAIAPKGCLLHAPDMYMQKIYAGPGFPRFTNNLFMAFPVQNNHRQIGNFTSHRICQGGEEVDIAVDPVEGTNLVAKGKNGAIAVLAIAPKRQ